MWTRCGDGPRLPGQQPCRGRSSGLVDSKELVDRVLGEGPVRPTAGDDQLDGECHLGQELLIDKGYVKRFLTHDCPLPPDDLCRPPGGPHPLAHIASTDLMSNPR